MTRDLAVKAGQPLPFFFRLKPYSIFWLVVAAVLSSAILYFDWDRALSALVYDQGNHWVGERFRTVGIVYNFGRLPIILAAACCLIGLVYIRSGALPAVYQHVIVPALASMLLANLLVIEGLTKHMINRPRPYEVEPFGGEWPFVSLFELGGSGDSFASGHAAAGFGLTAFFWGFYYIGFKRAAWLTYLFGILAGVILSAIRVLQGGHFFSDVIWSLIITQVVSVGLFHLHLKLFPYTLRVFQPKTVTPRPTLRPLLHALSVCILGLFVLFFLHNQRLYHHQREVIELPPNIEKVQVILNDDTTRIVLEHLTEQNAGFDYLVLGNAFPWVHFFCEVTAEITGKTAVIRYYIDRSTWFFGYNGRLALHLPKHAVLQVINPENVPYSIQETK